MSLNLGTLEPAKNTANLVADALRSAILQGKLQSGQSLKQDEIAAQFSVSKIPVREALVQLQAEGLVDLIPSRGAIVSHLSIAEVEEIYTIRLALEPLALKRAIPHMTSSDFLHMEVILDKIDNEANLTRWAELNWEFHDALYRPAQLPQMIQILRTLHNNVARFLLINYLGNTDYLKASQAQHREIVAFCRQGEVSAASDCLVRHLSEPPAIFRNQKAGE